MVHKAHLNAIIEKQRQITGAKRRHRLKTVTEATECIGRIMDYWETQLTELQLTSEVTNKLCSITDKGPGWWRALQRLPTEIECTEEIKEIRSHIHGRLRQEM